MNFLSDRPRGRMTVRLFLGSVLLSLALSGQAYADPRLPPEFWDGLRAIADTLAANPDCPIDQPPSYNKLSTGFRERLHDALRARISERDAAADSAIMDCRVAAQLAAQVYDTQMFLDRLEWAKGLSSGQAQIKIEADSLREFGRQRARSRDLGIAEPAIQSALALYRQIGDRGGIARAELDLVARPWPGLGIEERLEGVRDSEVSARRAGDLSVVLTAIWHQAILESRGGQPETALAVYDSLLKFAARLRDTAAEWGAWRGIGQISLQWSRLDEARRAFDRSLAAMISVPDTSFVATARICGTLNMIALVFEKEDQLDSAAHYWRRSLDLYERSANEAGILLACHEIGEAFYNSGQLDSAEVYLRRAVNLYRARADTLRAANDLYTLCLTLWYQDRHEEAMQCCEQALEGARATGHWCVEENAENIIGNILGAHGDWQRALPRFHRALEIATDHSDFVMQFYALCNIGGYLPRPDSVEAARRYYHRGLATFDSIPPEDQNDWDLKGSSLLVLSWFALGEGDTSEAIQLAEEAFRVSESTKHGDLGRCAAGHDLAYLLLQAGHLERAESLYHESLTAAEARGSTAYIAYNHAGLAEIAWQRKHQERALFELAAAICELETYRASLGSLPFRELWFASELWPFETMIRHSIELDKMDQAFEYFERMKARELLDLLAGGGIVYAEDLSQEDQAKEVQLVARIEDLNRRITDGDLNLKEELEEARAQYETFEQRLFRLYPGLRERRGKGNTILLEDAHRLLAADELALLYSFGPETPTLLAITRTQIKGYILESPTPVVRHHIEILVDSIKRGLGSFNRSRGEMLFEMLVGPARDMLSGKEHICFVPDGELYSIPFHALVDSESGHYLIEQYSVAVTPSLSTLASMRRKEPAASRAFLGFGDPDFGAAAPRVAMLRGSLAQLPYSGLEVTSVGGIYAPKAKVLTGMEATEQAFKSLAPDYGIIHLASHGLIDDGSPLYSSIALAKAGEEEDGFLEAREITKLRLNADIAVLSACETARGSITRGEGINGLLRSFFIAGVSTVVASLWPVEDESTALLMTEFHRQMKAGEPPAEALAVAQRLLFGGDQRFRHPYYWAGFQLYGDSQ